MDKRKIVLESCAQCPFVKIEADYSEDSFETLTRWSCDKLGTYVRRYVDWTDHLKYIPNNCPLPKVR